ncbi:MAG: 4-alpha-glucanotransferase, partial [Clostridiaceae bacterium]|nr:4-alpha-glucanotransferase [Clostridiaceae bacterium]
MKKDNFKWWRRRLLHNSQMYDVIRIDHFRAFADYYTIPYGSENAKSGTWEKGVGINFWNSMRGITENLKIIAEDLGGETPEVEKLIEDTGFPNMKILVFAFNTDLQNKFLPKNYNSNCVCYTGTHDNETVRGWLDHISKKEKIILMKYLFVFLWKLLYYIIKYF